MQWRSPGFPRKAFFLRTLLLASLVTGLLSGLSPRLSAAPNTPPAPPPPLEPGSRPQAPLPPGWKEVPVSIAPSQWRVWLESSAHKNPVSSAIPGAQQTQWVAGWRSPDGDLPLSFSQFKEFGANWQVFLQQARSNAAADLPALQIQWIRNKQRVVECGILRSPTHSVAATLCNPLWLQQIEPVFGEKIQVVVPNRSTAFFFPALASNPAAQRDAILKEFQESRFPVSLELLEWSPSGWRALGIFEP